MESSLPSDVTPDACCDTDSFAKTWTGYQGNVNASNTTNDSGVQSLDREFTDMYIEHRRSESKRRSNKEYDDITEDTKRHCFDSGIGDSLKGSVSQAINEANNRRAVTKIWSECSRENIRTRPNDWHATSDQGIDAYIMGRGSNKDNEVFFNRDSEGDTALHKAIIHGFITVVMIIIDIAQSPHQLDLVNDMQQAPLILAAMLNQALIVGELIVSGANRLVTDRHGDTALHIAARNGHVATMRALMSHISKGAAQDDDYFKETDHIKQELNARDYEGYAPFHLATRGGHLDVLTYLEEIGADVDVVEGKAGFRPLHLAVANEDRATIRHLVENCYVDVDAGNFYGLSPIELANEKEMHDVVVYLADVGADRSDVDVPEFTDQDDDSPDEYLEVEFADLRINGVPAFQ